jgi:hypothetical protein
MTVPRIVGLVALISSVTACGSGTLILWNPKTGECDAVPKAAAYALGGVLFATTQDVDKWRCEGLKDGDKAWTEKPKQ